jgi:hypothetical protein
LAATGMRISEVLGLSCGDVDLEAGVLNVRWAKNSRSRIVPLHPSTTNALRIYQSARRKRFGRSTSGPFFVRGTGTALNYRMVLNAFVKATTTIGLRTQTVHPRIHDLRHSFAVHTLIGWQRSGMDVGAQMTRLSTYLGHADPAGTYWYLSAVPELMAPSAARLTRGSGRSQSDPVTVRTDLTDVLPTSTAHRPTPGQPQHYHRLPRHIRSCSPSPRPARPRPQADWTSQTWTPRSSRRSWTTSNTAVTTA